ncbi:MAG: caspase family protein, partial [Planktothrix sp.]
MPWNYERTNFDRNLAVVIGIDHYKNKSIHDLKTPVSDAKAIANLLQTQYKYQPENIISVLDEAATLSGLQTLLNDTLLKQLKPTDADRLIFYFAGHGIPRNSNDGPAGYLVPQDADGENQDSFLAMTDLCEALKKLECHHLLVILDCCFAGMFNWASHRKMIPILKTVYKEHYDRFIRYPAWQVITSSAQDQEALDVATLAQDKRGSIPDQNQELHSPFALGLLEGLLENKADFTDDQVITAHELYLYLEQRVSELSGEHQKPGLHSMRLEYDKGEFIFTQPDFNAKKQLQSAPILNEINNPYRGLKAFEERHSLFFFGRETLVKELSDRLVKSAHPLTVVVGASGSGKSSLVKAGLLPNLRDSQQKSCYILDTMRPGKSPFTELAKILLPVKNPNLLTQLTQVSFLDQRLADIVESQRVQSSNPTSDEIKKLAQSWHLSLPETKLCLVVDYWHQLQTFCDQPQEQKQLEHLYRAIQETLKPLIQEFKQNPQSLTSIIKKWSQVNPSTQLLLVIDQFEELITMSPQIAATEQQQWQQFLSLLKTALECHANCFHLVVTLRSDFEPRFHNSPLTPYWQNGRFPIRIMTSDELRDAIEKPACKQALHFEPSELVGRLIDELAQTPGALPLLSFTLSELYIKLAQRWREDPNCCDRALRMQDYEELGGVNGALTRRATEEYNNLIKELGQVSGEAHQMTLRRLMLRMVTIEGGEIARRRIPESELIYTDPQENKRVAEVIERLVNARLIVKSQESGESCIEPAHDYLVRGWDLLQKWLKQEESNLALQKSLILTVSDWNKAAETAKQGFKNSEVVRLLWNNDPRLPILKQILNSHHNWLNKLESEFIQNSIYRKRRNNLILGSSITGVLIGLLGFSGYIYT